MDEESNSWDWFKWAPDEFADEIVGLVPAVPVQVREACASIEQAGSSFAVLTHFVPFWALIGIAIVLSIVGAVVAIRLIRVAISLLSGGGGA